MSLEKAKIFFLLMLNAKTLFILLETLGGNTGSEHARRAIRARLEELALAMGFDSWSRLACTIGLITKREKHPGQW